jgi:hypothetical protein
MRSHPRIIRPAAGKKNAGGEWQLVPAKGNYHNDEHTAVRALAQ